MTKIGICVAGYGYFGQKLYGYLTKMNECEVRYLYHTDETKARSYGPLGNSDLVKIIHNQSVDAFVVATPNDQHFDLLWHLLNRGRHHVFVEKPMANSYDEGLRLAGLLKDHRGVFMVGHCHRRENVYRKAKEFLNAGVIGKIVNINFNYSSAKVFTIGKNEWRASAVRADLGPLAMVGSHCIDTIHYLFGKVVSVYARLQNLTGKTESPDTSSVVLNLENEATVFLQCNYNVPIDRYCFISGIKGAIYIDRNRLWLRADPDQMTEDQKFIPSEKIEIEVVKNDPIEEELKEFLNAIRTGKKVETGYEEGLAVIRVLEACRRSAKENVPIRLS